MAPTEDHGTLQVNLVSIDDNIPVSNAVIRVSYSGGPKGILEELITDENGMTDIISLPSPPLEYSLEENRPQPYSEYTVSAEAIGYEPYSISGIEIMPNVKSTLQIKLSRNKAISDNSYYAIGPHTLYGDYPPKIPESEIKTLTESGEIVLSRVVIPETIIVHDGPPADSSAPNYYVSYKDYIKNVASSEIYATWPDAAIRANILAILSFTLNRVYTEWYRNKGYSFTITSSTAYDHKWIPNRNYFDTISTVVDEIFSQYLSRPNVKQPILTQYCDGRRVSCNNWMSQWGSKDLADDGFSTLEILRYYYGDNMYINSTETISGIPSSWPGYDLNIGSSGPKVFQLQEELNTIAEAYPSIPLIIEDGIYGPATAEAVKKFQSVFSLPPNGIVDYPTWYKISEIYVGVSRISS